jgi:hypothetical protein
LPKESRDGIEFPLVLRQDGVWHVVQLDDAVGRPILTLEGADHHIANLFNWLNVVNVILEVDIVDRIEIVEVPCRLALEDHWSDTSWNWELNHLGRWQHIVSHVLHRVDVGSLLICFGILSFLIECDSHILVIASGDCVQLVLLLVMEHDGDICEAEVPGDLQGIASHQGL